LVSNSTWVGSAEHCPTLRHISNKLTDEDFLMYELCFPGAITGETEFDCPYCGTQLTVTVEDPMGEASFQCCECTGVFEVDFGKGVVRYEV